MWGTTKDYKRTQRVGQVDERSRGGSRRDTLPPDSIALQGLLGPKELSPHHPNLHYYIIENKLSSLLGLLLLNSYSSKNYYRHPIMIWTSFTLSTCSMRSTGRHACSFKVLLAFHACEHHTPSYTIRFWRNKRSGTETSTAETSINRCRSPQTARPHLDLCLMGELGSMNSSLLAIPTHSMLYGVGGIICVYIYIYVGGTFTYNVTTSHSSASSQLLYSTLF